jgi:hypothetical protein
VESTLISTGTPTAELTDAASQADLPRLQRTVTSDEDVYGESDEASLNHGRLRCRSATYDLSEQPCSWTPVSDEVVTAEYAYKATQPTELSFDSGDQMRIIRKDPTGWWFAVHVNGGEGWIPSNFLQL